MRVRQTATRKKSKPALRKRVIRHAPKKHRNVRRELSAGGVAVRQERGIWHVALLKTEHRRGSVWVLPKGHVEMHKQERVADAAKREVQEEAGIMELEVKDQLGTTRFVFQAETALVKKTVHYFLMITTQKELVPQAEEGFIDAGWFPIDVAITMLEYDTDQDIVSKAKDILEGKVAAVSAIPSAGRKVIKIHS
ncbi:MAG TPA: NUDIX hydrolase [Candidatus Andersenbacteria bacterium]|nr:NUDIX hydrolase [Candidatus Andersenbacteria bacterium]